MTSSDQFQAFAAARGEGLHPKLRDLLQRTAASPFSETSIRPDGMLQAGPNPASEMVPESGTVVSFPPDWRPPLFLVDPDGTSIEFPASSNPAQKREGL
jgi:hypothetical protein